MESTPPSSFAHLFLFFYSLHFFLLPKADFSKIYLPKNYTGFYFVEIAIFSEQIERRYRMDDDFV